VQSQAANAKRLAKAQKLQELWKQEHGIEDDSDSDDDSYGLASPSQGSSPRNSAAAHQRRRSQGRSKPMSPSGPPSAGAAAKRRVKQAYIGKNGKKPTSWTTGMLWSEHYNR